MNDWSLYDSESFEDFTIWLESNRTVWPYPGGRRDQPWWVTEDFKTLRMVRRWHEINDSLEDSTALPPMPIQ